MLRSTIHLTTCRGRRILVIYYVKSQHDQCGSSKCFHNCCTCCDRIIAFLRSCRWYDRQQTSFRYGARCTGCRKYRLCALWLNPGNRSNRKNCCQYQKRRTYTDRRNGPLCHTCHRACRSDALCRNDPYADDRRDPFYCCLQYVPVENVP